MWRAVLVQAKGDERLNVVGLKYTAGMTADDPAAPVGGGRGARDSGVSMTTTEDEDEWELREVRRPKGTHRSRSSETPGADRELLREDGTNRNLGPSESRGVDEEALRLKYQGDPIFLTPDSVKRPGSDGDSRYLIPTSRSLSAWTA